ncbi:uncharacterized protein M421DRAFT_270884 [Didymella exigua CBS 183.55]|uniref:Uncharacterized protein n=1 Tax=Didymella exigua CBS 183.55 TaxID=1150837 RepID=A0A6A5RBZ0_9PLEO|nr:uncharacterized protein M421DRAFT_270884 [Didymella exigua CBS 183.55]KAF1924790.1 hypothetical protein M421DRAFT_270884 [Didymella exigua CBS 183.55]
MSPTSSRAAIRFVVALFLAQTFVNAVAVPHPHIHKVLDPRQVVSLPFVERQEPAEPESKNVFDAIVETLKGYNGWQVFQDFFRKLFSGDPPPAENDDDSGEAPSVSVSLAPVPVASESPVDVISVIASIISEVESVTEPVVIVPTPTEAETSTTDGIMSILPIFPITTAIDLSGALETVVPTEFLSELPEPTEVPEVTDPVVIVVPGANSTDVVVVLPTDVVAPIGTAPLVTGPVVVLPTATDAPFPIENGTLVAPIPGTDVPVVIVLPTGVLPSEISAPVEANVSASAVIDATVSLTTTVGVTITAIAPIGTGALPSAGTGLPITISEVGAPFANATVITPTLVLVTGTGDVVGTIAPSVSIEPIGAPFANSSDAATAVASVGTAPVVIIGTGAISGTAVVSIEPVETIILSTGTGIVGTGESTAVAPIDTAVPFPNTTAIEVVISPTFVLPSGTAPVVGTISAAPIVSDASDALYANTTTTTVTNIVTPSAILATGIETAVAPIGTGLPGTIVVVPGPGSTDDAYFPNITITINATADATLSVELPLATALPVETTLPLNITLAPIAPVETEFPASPIETMTAVGPVIDEPIPSDAPVVEFPGLLALRGICRDPSVRQITLPILNRFYGPSAYPSLLAFPGCHAPNSRQTIQAPGLLNCTALGAEVKACQASRRRVLLSVKGDGLGAVAGNQNFGDPSADAAPWGGYFANGSAPAAGVFFPNLFDTRHVPSAFALTLFSLFGEGRTERADLRPLGPDTPSEDGITWVTKPLGEEVVVDGFDVQVPREWQGTYQEGQFNDLVTRLGELNDEAWVQSGAKRGGPGDLGVAGKSVVFQGWNRKRSVQRVVMVGGFEVLVE